MKSLLGFALLLLLISGLGYFALLNNHNVAVHLYGSFTLQFAVWTMILGCFALGFLLSESRFLFSSPQSWINRLRKIWKNRGEKQRLGPQDHFRKALLEGNYAEMKKNFQLLEKDPEALIHLKTQHLEQLRFFESKEEVQDAFDNKFIFINRNLIGFCGILLYNPKFRCNDCYDNYYDNYGFLLYSGGLIHSWTRWKF